MIMLVVWRPAMPDLTMRMSIPAGNISCSTVGNGKDLRLHLSLAFLASLKRLSAYEF